MRKRMLVMAATAAALTLSTAITAFAGTWKSDAFGTYYEDDNGYRPVYAGWFTDPADGAMYYMDPDGYMMTNTRVEGYRIGDDGKRVEKTEEDIAQENERKAQLASRPSPAKAAAAADVAAEAARTATAAKGTIRGTYIAEMTTFMKVLFQAANDTRTDKTVKGNTTTTNTLLTYSFLNPDKYPFLSSTLWKVAKETGADYHENAIDLTYHYDAIGGDDQAIYTNAFEKLVVAAVGDTAGQALVDTINAERAAGTASFQRTGATDSGNTYTLNYTNNLATLKVVCSEVDAAADAAKAEAADAAQAETEADATAAEETVANNTAAVLVAGQAAADNADDTTADAADETEADATADGNEA